MSKAVSPEKSKQRKIIDIVVTCIEVIIVIIAITISAIVISNPSSNDVTGKGIKLLPVLSDSMKGDGKDNFETGDLVIAKTPKDVFDVQVGQIITYNYSINGYDVLNTHRIISIVYDGSGKPATYITHGDNNPEGMVESVNPRNVVAVYKGKIKGLGGAITWLQDSTHFLLIIVLPLAALFIYNIVMFVLMLMRWKVEKAKESVSSAPASEAIDEEEIKRKAIEEYLAAQKDAEAEKPAEDDEPAEQERKE